MRQMGQGSLCPARALGEPHRLFTELLTCWILPPVAPVEPVFTTLPNVLPEAEEARTLCVATVPAYLTVFATASAVEDVVTVPYATEMIVGPTVLTSAGSMSAVVWTNVLASTNPVSVALTRPQTAGTKAMPCALRHSPDNRRMASPLVIPGPPPFAVTVPTLVSWETACTEVYAIGRLSRLRRDHLG
jgi:hypothetical protein